MGIKTGFLKYAVLVGALAVVNGVVQAGPIFTGSSGDRAASAQFDVSGTDLVVTLTNTSTIDVLEPVYVLTALFFTIAGDPTLTPVSATLASGSTVLFGPINGGNVGGEWAYADGLSGAPGSADEGISSSGYGLFGINNFNGINLQGPDVVDGLQYGITSAGDDPTTGNAPVTGRPASNPTALIKNSVVFKLSGLPQNFSLYDQNTTKISNVSFQYGTSLADPNITGECKQNCTPPPPCTVNCGGGTQGIPEPATVGLLGLGMLAMSAIRRRKITRS